MTLLQHTCIERFYLVGNWILLGFFFLFLKESNELIGQKVLEG